MNYLSALSKGLSAANLATEDVRYLDTAIALHLNDIIPNQLAAGYWNDAHNQRLEYHGFIVSGLIALIRDDAW